MNHQTNAVSSQRNNPWGTIGICLVLVGMFWAVRYAHLYEFGWYEDDLTIIPRAITLSAPDLFAYVWSYIVNLYGHGRPLSDSLIYIFSHYGWMMDGITGAYWIGFLIQAINLALFYLLLKRLHSGLFALIGSLAYLLYSADTTQVFLTHSLGLHPSITLLLLGFHAYLSRRQWLAYPLVFLILFSYETPYLLFTAAPLLALQWKPGWWKDLLRHAAILAGWLVAIYILRMSVGEGRVEGLSTLQMILTPFLHALQGPVVSLGTYFYRPVQALQALNLEIALAIGIGFVIFSALLLRARGDRTWTPEQVQNAIRGIRPARWWVSIRKLALPAEIPNEVQRLLRLAAAGLIMLVAAYPLTFTVRAYAISGRDTRVHAAAVVGAAFLWACIGTLLIQAAQAYGKKLFAVLPLAALFALVAGYGFVVQRDYRLGWDYQQQFWSELLPLVQDAGPDTVILIEPTGLRDTRQIGANTWNLPRILNQIYEMPEGWENPPRVFRLIPNWQNQIITEDGLLRIDAATTIAPPSLYTAVDPEQVIFIESRDGRLARRETPLPIGNEQVVLMPAGDPQLSDLPHGFLYPILIGAR